MSQQQGERILGLESVSVLYRDGIFSRNAFAALSDVSFDVFHGETLGVIGHNGSGKSTLLRLLAGIYAPDSGRLWRQPGTSASLLALQVGFVKHLTGRENVFLSGMLLGMTKQEVAARMDDIIAFSELADAVDRPVRSYSTGMRARLGFSVAYYADPDIILLDEVLGVGDVDFKAKSAAAMREKIRQDKTAVLVTHQPGMVEEMCDRVVWIERGQVMKLGRPAEVLEDYLAHRHGRQRARGGDWQEGDAG